MLCPKCGCDTKICDTRYDKKENEVFRRHVCKSCRNEIFTIEFEIENNSKFAKIWRTLTRGSGRSFLW